MTLITKRERGRGEHDATRRAASPPCFAEDDSPEAHVEGHAGGRRRPLPRGRRRDLRARGARPRARARSRAAPASTRRAGASQPHARGRPLRAPRRARGRRHRRRGRARAARPRPAAHPNIRILEHHTAIDLIMLSRFGGPDHVRRRLRARRASAGAAEQSHVVETYLARATVLATGGAGKVYLYTTNPDVATGDGVAMAYRAGRRDREHGVLPVPPHLPLPPARRARFLISEALRGEGAILRLARRDGVHGATTTRARSSRRATSWPARSTSR